MSRTRPPGRHGRSASQWATLASAAATWKWAARPRLLSPMLPIITETPAASAMAFTLSALRMPPVFMSFTTNTSHASASTAARASRGPRTDSSRAMGTSTRSRSQRAARRSSMRTGCSTSSMPNGSSSLIARNAVFASHQPWLASTVMRASGPGRLAHRRHARGVPLRGVAHLDLEDGDAFGAHLARLGRERLGLVPAEGDDLEAARRASGRR